MATDPIDVTTKKILLGLAMFFAVLIGVVVVVGLLRRDLNPVGVASILSGILTGLVSAIVLGKGGNNDKPSDT